MADWIVSRVCLSGWNFTELGLVLYYALFSRNKWNFPVPLWCYIVWECKEGAGGWIVVSDNDNRLVPLLHRITCHAHLWWCVIHYTCIQYVICLWKKCPIYSLEERYRYGREIKEVFFLNGTLNMNYIIFSAKMYNIIHSTSTCFSHISQCNQIHDILMYSCSA